MESSSNDRSLFHNTQQQPQSNSHHHHHHHQQHQNGSQFYSPGYNNGGHHHQNQQLNDNYNKEGYFDDLSSSYHHQNYGYSASSNPTTSYYYPNMNLQQQQPQPQQYHSYSQDDLNLNLTNHDDHDGGSEFMDVFQIADLLDTSEYSVNENNKSPKTKHEILNDLKSTVDVQRMTLLGKAAPPFSSSFLKTNMESNPNSTGTSDLSPGVSNTISSQSSPADNQESNSFRSHPFCATSVNELRESSTNATKSHCGLKKAKRQAVSINRQRIFDTITDELDECSSPNSNINNMSRNSNGNSRSAKTPFTNRNISFVPWETDKWVELFTLEKEKIEEPIFEVEADKGFYYSNFDDAFICQKKNHFQITVHAFLNARPHYCRSRTTMTTLTTTENNIKEETEAEAEEDHRSNSFDEIENVTLQLYGLKQEAPLHRIPIRQYDSDRKSIEYDALACKLTPMQACKFTKMRLHFAQTTHNNNRKKNRPNPDQRYFLLVVELQIKTKSNQMFTLCSFASERIIVRAVNPGQFKKDLSEEAATASSSSKSALSKREMLNSSTPIDNVIIKSESLIPPIDDDSDYFESNAQPSLTPPTVPPDYSKMENDKLHNDAVAASMSSNIMDTFSAVDEIQSAPHEVTAAAPAVNNFIHFGNIGINTDEPDEALTVFGNLKLMGNILQPSDMRIKDNFKQINIERSLENLKKLELYKYDFRPEFAELNGGMRSDIGILAQDLQKIIPEAVHQSGNVVLSNGKIVENLLIVDKNRLNMECLGAVKALGSKTEDLDNKIIKLEQCLIRPVNLDANDLISPQILSSNENTCSKKIKYTGPLKFKITKKKSINVPNNCCTRICANKRGEVDAKTFKAFAAVTMILIALGILGIVIILGLEHSYNVNRRKSEDQDNSNDQSQKLNTSYYYLYPKITPPVVQAPNCPATQASCMFCCAVSGMQKVQISDTSNIIEYSSLNSQMTNNIIEELENYDDSELSETQLQELSEEILEQTRFINTNLSEYTKLSGILLFANNPNIIANLSLNGNCSMPYCETLNNIQFYFVPISTNVDTRTQFDLVFFVNNNYSIKFCQNANNGIICPNLDLQSTVITEPIQQASTTTKTSGTGPDKGSTTTTTTTSTSTTKSSTALPTTQPASLQGISFTNQLKNLKQYIFYTHISYFLQVDYEFRLYSSSYSSGDICSIADNDPSFERLIFRFYRLC